jgi:uncharacterized protein with HEPN domain
MYDKELVLEVLSQISRAGQTVIQRFKSIKSPNDFIDSVPGIEKYDSICMQLIAIGQGLNNLDKISGNSLLKNYKQIDWEKAKFLWDMLSHHYHTPDAEAVFEVCRDSIPDLAETIEIIIKDLS